MKKTHCSTLSLTAFKMLLVASLLFAWASCGVAQDDGAAKDGNPPPQNDAVELRREVAKLKREVARLKEQLEIAEHNGFYWPGKKAVGSPIALLKGLPTVSYTHLTLPTILRV